MTTARMKLIPAAWVPDSTERRILRWPLFVLIGLLLHLAIAGGILVREGEVMLFAVAIGHPWGPFFFLALAVGLASVAECLASYAGHAGRLRRWCSFQSVCLLASGAAILVLGLAVQIAINDYPLPFHHLGRRDLFLTFFLVGTINAAAVLALLLWPRRG